MQALLNDYSAYLDEQSIHYYARDGFSVSFEMPHIAHVLINVLATSDDISIWEYIALSDTGPRDANRLLKKLRARYPQYHFQKDHYTSYEISVSDRFPFSSVEHLHERICALTSVVDDCYVIGKEIPGDRFHR